MNAELVCYPIGKDASFNGIIDLIEEKAYCFLDEGGRKIQEFEIPDDYRGLTKTYWQWLIEKLSENDDQLLELLLDETPISKNEIKSSIRRQVIEQKFSPVFCGSAFKNKGV